MQTLYSTYDNLPFIFTKWPIVSLLSFSFKKAFESMIFALNILFLILFSQILLYFIHRDFSIRELNG